MKNPKKIGTIGFIIKKEKLAGLETSIDFKELILEDIDPFPGYYHATPGDWRKDKPKFLFFVVEPFPTWNNEKIIRKTIKIKKNFPYTFDALPGQISLFNKMYSCIRISVNNYSFLGELVDAFKKEGVIFRKKKNIKPYESLIKVLKFLEMEEKEENIFTCTPNDEINFIRLPIELDWNLFEEITYFLKYNNEYKSYDAALSSIYDKTGMIDMVRIFDKEINIEKLRVIKNGYLSEIKRRSL